MRALQTARLGAGTSPVEFSWAWLFLFGVIVTDSYYPFFPGDYLRDTQDLSLTEHGAYLIMLSHYYCHEGLTSNKSRLYRICKAFTDEEKESIDTVRERYFMDDGNGNLINKRAEIEIKKRKAFLEEQSRKGKISARVRWGGK